MTAPSYRVKNWDRYFENNRTRDMKSMQWVPVPNKHDGEAYQTIMMQPDGLKIFGCWVLILQVASRVRDRGTLMRDDGTPMTAHTLSLKTGWRTVKDFERALQYLSLPEIGWLERLTPEGAEKPQEGAGFPQEGARNGIEGNGIEGKGNTPLTGSRGVPLVFDTDRFKEAWKCWRDHRKKLRKPMTEKAEELAMAKLKDLTETEAIRWIYHAIDKGWQGLYKPDDAQLKRGQMTPDYQNEIRAIRGNPDEEGDLMRLFEKIRQNHGPDVLKTVKEKANNAGLITRSGNRWVL